MGGDFLRHYMVVYIGKKIAANINIDEIIDLFDRPRRSSKFKVVDIRIDIFRVLPILWSLSSSPPLCSNPGSAPGYIRARVGWGSRCYMYLLVLVFFFVYSICKFCFSIEILKINCIGPLGTP
jgi:hypothetical protein